LILENYRRMHCETSIEIKVSKGQSNGKSMEKGMGKIKAKQLASSDFVI